MKEYFSHTLANGLRIVHMPTDSKVSYCGFIINAGTRDEDESIHGMAHFIEHMLFKGTKRRRSHHIINRMELVGGELNAYTTKEETVIYSAFLESHFERAFDLLQDVVFNSEFPQKEIEKEIEVIVDEIHSYEDSPSELIYDDFENIIFNGSAIGHNILGTPKHLLEFNTKKARSFYEKYYVPSNVVFFSLGKTDFKKIVRLAEKHITSIERGDFNNNRIKPLEIDQANILDQKASSQAHVVIGCRSYPVLDDKRQTLYLLNNILGGPNMNSRLNVSLREKRGYVYNIDSSATAYTDTGVFSIYFGTDKKNTNKCIKLVYEELRKLREQPLTASQLSAAKKQMIGQIAVASDNKENLALSLGRSYMHHNHIKSLSEIFEQIELVSSQDIQEVANELLQESRLFSLIYN